MIKFSNLKNKFKNKKKIFGAWNSIPNNLISEIFARSNVDFLGVDIEHSSMSFEQIQNIIISSQSLNIPCLPRIASINNESIKRILDMGADGIIVPNVETEKDIENLTLWTKYPPVGNRGYGIARAQGYGHNFNHYVKSWNNKSVLIIQIESIKAIENLDKLLRFKAVDAVMIGPYDISGSLGIPGQINHSKVKKACEEVLKICKKYSKPCGIQDSNPNKSSIDLLIKRGYSFIVLSSDIFALWEWTNQIKKILLKVKNQ